MNIYLADKMRGRPGFGFGKFHEMARVLRSQGHTVFNPAAQDENDGFNPETDEPDHISAYMVKDIPAVMEADAVVLGDMWHESQGAILEAFSAAWVGKKVIKYTGWEDVSLGTIIRTMREWLANGGAEAIMEDSRES